MIDESNITGSWLRTAAGIAAISALSLGTVSCNQPDTPSTLEDATEAPGVTTNDAAQASDGGDASQDRGMARVNQLRRDMRAQVAAGEITGEQARQRISRALQRLEAAGGETAGDQASSDRPSEGDGTARINHLRRDLRARVRAGEITEEQMRQRVSRALQRLEASRREGGNR